MIVLCKTIDRRLLEALSPMIGKKIVGRMVGRIIVKRMVERKIVKRMVKRIIVERIERIVVEWGLVVVAKIDKMRR